MQRVVVDHYGGPEVLKVVEEDAPRPGPGALPPPDRIRTCDPVLMLVPREAIEPTRLWGGE